MSSSVSRTLTQAGEPEHDSAHGREPGGKETSKKALQKMLQHRANERREAPERPLSKEQDPRLTRPLGSPHRSTGSRFSISSLEREEEKKQEGEREKKKRKQNSKKQLNHYH